MHRRAHVNARYGGLGQARRQAMKITQNGDRGKTPNAAGSERSVEQPSGEAEWGSPQTCRRWECGRTYNRSRRDVCPPCGWQAGRSHSARDRCSDATIGCDFLASAQAVKRRYQDEICCGALDTVKFTRIILSAELSAHLPECDFLAGEAHPPSSTKSTVSGRRGDTEAQGAFAGYHEKHCQRTTRSGRFTVVGLCLQWLIARSQPASETA
jgi:hypothetical protein